jgi:putative transposase
MLTLKRQKTYLELPLQLYDAGIKKIKYRLLELHPEFDYIIENVYLKFLVRKNILLRDEKLLIVVSAPKNKLMILKDKKILLDPITLTMNWLLMLGAELTLREKDCKEFWNGQCLENSKKLWFPTEIGCADLHLSYLNGSLPKTVQNSWFLTKQMLNPAAKSLPKTFSPLFKYSPVEKWEKEGIRALNPSKEQEKILEEWSNTTRYVYNKCLDKIKTDPKLNCRAGYKKLNKECITEKDNNIIKPDQIHTFDKFIYDWVLRTPKDIRNGALRDIKKGFVTAWANLKAGNITSFGLNFREKKSYKEQSMEVPRSAIKLVKSHGNVTGFNIYKSYIPSVIKVAKNSLKGINLETLTHDTRLKKENNEWFLCISYDTEGNNTKIKEKTCALDPGIRKFQTIYSEDNVTIIEPDKKKIIRIYNTLDKFQELRDIKKIRQRTYDKKRCRLQSKLSCYVDEMHYKTIAFLTKNYTSILLPSFESQDMVKSRKLHRTTKRDMMNFSFYKFQQRLVHKCALLKHCNVTIVNEAYTSQTCGHCGNLKKTSNEIITCDKCNKTFDRDVNGARNIYLKYVQ